MSLRNKWILFCFTLLFIFSSFLFPDRLFGQTDFSGFIRSYNGIQNQSGHNLIIGRNRLRLELEKDFAGGKIVASNDLQHLYQTSKDSAVYRLREFYIDLFFKNSDLRIGKQIITWGRTDGAFISDIISPADLSEFLTQDFSDLRTGVTAFSYNYYLGSDYFQLIFNPVFKSNFTPRFESRWFPRTIVSTALPAEVIQQNSDPDLGDIQVAGRFAFRSNINFDLDIALLFWHYPNPSYFKDLNIDNAGNPSLDFVEDFKQSFIATYSGSIKLTDKLYLKSESAFYADRTFDYLSNRLQNINLRNPSPSEQTEIIQIFNQNTDGFLLEKPWLQTMIGIQYELFDTSISTQFINEHIFNFNEVILQEQNYHYSTLQLDRDFFRNTWTARVFGRYNFNGSDFWLNPEIIYTGIDSFEASLGTQIFGGKTPETNFGHLSFDNFDENSFTYLKLSAFF